MIGTVEGKIKLLNPLAVSWFRGKKERENANANEETKEECIEESIFAEQTQASKDATRDRLVEIQVSIERVFESNFRKMLCLRESERTLH